MKIKTKRLNIKNNFTKKKYQCLVLCLRRLIPFVLFWFDCVLRALNG